MYYIVVKQPPHYHQLSLDEYLNEILFGVKTNPVVINRNETNTRTYEVPTISSRVLSRIDVNQLYLKLVRFNIENSELREVERHSLYTTFYIPKNSGGLRRIDAPKDKLMEALRVLKKIFEEDFGALYHTSAFAYIKKRCTIDSIKRHQQNESNWFGKYDLHDFFGSTTPEFVIKQFSMVFPFSELLKTRAGMDEFKKAIDLAFLDGGLPQGTPISPLITNVMMIPIDYKLSNKLRDYEKHKFVYTRYADDFLISSKYNFDVRKIENLICGVLAEFEAPFSINARKTRYGSRSGSNWNLGVMLNKDNEITVGYKAKRQLKAMVNSYIADHQNGVVWENGDVMVLNGIISYHRMVEKESTDYMISHLGQKYNADIIAVIKEQLRSV